MGINSTKGVNDFIKNPTLTRYEMDHLIAILCIFETQSSQGWI